MPRFIEERLRKAAAAAGLSGKRADHYVYGAMNDMGAMRGNQETPKGRRMEIQHERDTSAARKQSGGHPHRLAGSHEGGVVTEHHRKRR